jgi:CheY-like chemotaxis protein/HPt (histidine-containing phosphotransfer) domain-containing protein
VSGLLLQQGFECVLVSSGIDAVVRVHASLNSTDAAGSARRPGDGLDVVIIGHSLPGLTGVEAAQLIRSMAHWHPYAARLPIIGANDEHQTESLAAGMDVCLAKPFSRDSCVSMVEELVARARAAQLACGLHSAPPDAVRASAGYPTSDWSVVLFRTFALKLVTTLDQQVASSDETPPRTVAGALEPRLYAAALHWACAVLGAHGASECYDELCGVLMGTRADAMSKAQPVVVRLRAALASHEAAIDSAAGAHETAVQAALHLPTFEQLEDALELSRMFLRINVKRLEELRPCIESADWAKCERLAHNIKVNARWLGLRHLDCTAAVLEVAAQSSQHVGACVSLEERLWVDWKYASERLGRLLDASAATLD